MCRKIPHENRETPRAAKSSDFALWIEARSLRSLPSWSILILHKRGLRGLCGLALAAAGETCAVDSPQRRSQFVMVKLLTRKSTQPPTVQQLFTGLPWLTILQWLANCPKDVSDLNSWGTNRSFSFAMPCLLARSCKDFWDPVTFMPRGSSWPSLPLELRRTCCFSPPVQPLKAEKEKRSMIYWRKGMQGLVEPWYLVLAASRC